MKATIGNTADERRTLEGARKQYKDKTLPSHIRREAGRVVRVMERNQRFSRARVL